MSDQHTNYQELCAKLYASQVKNRLHELESASDDELSRWIWELIQNAKDCSDKRICFIPNKPNQNPKKKTIDIRLVIKNNNEVIFKHNGYPFIQKTLDSLMYRFSSKNSDNESTGRFGTGFMTSHTLSRVVQIDAPYIECDGEKKRISATVFREGSSESQLREEFYKMEKSKKISEYDKNNPEHKWTSFSYKLTNNIGHKSLNLGIKSFRNNIIKALLFCPEIKSIQIDNEKPYVYTLISSVKYNDTSFKNQIDIEKRSFTNDKETHQYIIFTVNEINDHYSKKKAKDNETKAEQKNIVFSIVFEINSENKLIYDQDSNIRLFCTFPLIGSTSFQLPYLLNSPIFEVKTERNGIFLDGDSYDHNNILTNRGLNEIILLGSISLFKVAIKWFIENNFTNFCIFAKDISNPFSFSEKMIDINQSPKISDSIKNILEESRIVKNSSNQNQQLKSVFFLNFDGVENANEFHSIVSQFYLNIASYDDCKNWENLIWDKLHSLSLENFIEHISCIGSNKQFRYPDNILKRSNLLTSLNSLTNDDFTFLLRLYTFFIQEESINVPKFLSKIWKYPIVLNSNCSFSLINELKCPINLPAELNTIMNVCQSWGYKMVHHKIDCFMSILPNATINDAQNEINSFLINNQQNNELLLSFIKFIPNNNDQQLTIYKLAKKFYNNIANVPPKIDVSDVDESLWEKVNFYLLKCIQKMISSHENSSINIDELDDYNDFYNLYQKICHDSNFLVPNYKLTLKKKNELKSIDNNISQAILEELQDFIHIDLYVHPLITSVKFTEKLDLSLLISDINKAINSNDKILSSVLSFFPPRGNQLLYNIQEKISKIASFFLNLSIHPKQTSIVDEKFWYRANENVRNRIKKKLESSNFIDQLENELNKPKTQIFEHLNIYISVNIQLNNLNWKENTLIPNYLGNFCQAKYLSIIENVPEHYFRLYNIIKDDSNIEESFAHSNIKCEYLKKIDLNKFIKMICLNVSDEQLVHDKNIYEAIFQIHPFNTLKSSNNNLLLEKVYTANIYNKLNDLNNPTENDKKRWGWELIQYALDSCGQNKIDVTFETKSNNNNQYTELIFSHNGRGFDEISLLKLIFALNPKEYRKNAKRYGSGFISTHVLSKKVEISGNVISHGKSTGFLLQINREGTTNESIINDFRKIQNSCQCGKGQMNLTSIKYFIQTQDNRDSLKLGLEHIESHIYQVLINCPELKSVHIKRNGIEQIFSIPNQSPEIISNFQLFRYQILENQQKYQYFVLKDESNKINISVKLNEKNEIVHRNNDLVSIFSLFPLTGSQNHILPYFLHSPEIIPTTKYDSLILNGSETSTLEKNRSILMKSIDLYKVLITKLNEQKCSNMHEMSVGLLLSEKPYNSFDLDWYQNNYLAQMQDAFSNLISIQTYSGSSVLIKDAYFPDPMIEDKEMLQDYIAIVYKCFHNNIINVPNAEQWKGKIWTTAHFIKVDDLLNEVKSNKELLDEPNLTFYNEFLKFIWKLDHKLLYNNEVIPDMTNQLHCYPNIEDNKKEIFRECKNVSNDIIEIMESIEIPWRKTHMNNAIHSIPLSEDKQIDAQSRIIEKVHENNAVCFNLMRFVEQDDIFRKEMFNITNQFFLIEGKEIFESFYTTKNIDRSVWDFADSYVLRNIADTISKYDQNKVRDNISFFRKFIPVFIEYFKKDTAIITSVAIIPNKIYQLKSLKQLSNALINPQNKFNIHEYLNQILKKYLNRDFDEKIIHPAINESIKSSQNERLSDFMNLININLKNESESNIEIAKAILSLLPENKKSQNLSKQEQLLELYNDIFDKTLQKIYIDDSIFSKYYWNQSNKIIISFICQYIQDSKTLSAFQQKLPNCKKCFNILNLLYEFVEKETDLKPYKIIPNIKGDFMIKSDLMQNPEIDEQLINCINYLDPNFLIQDKIVDIRININGLKKFDIFDFYKKLNKLFNDALKKDDEKAYEMIKKINGIDDSSFLDKVMKHNLTNEEQLRMDIFINAHINFLENYLREVDFKSMKEKIRWPFELIQNANDTVQETGRKVDIIFELTKDKFIFSHNGEPFQNNSLLSLLYQSSYGKKKKSTTGKFGTGFLSTMVLSKRIHLTSDLIIPSEDDKSEDSKGFEVTIFRDGSNSSDLKEGIKLMENSLKKGLPRKNKTQFEYYLDSNEDKASSAIEIGIKYLKENISAILILNNSIKSITIKKDNQTETYELNEKKNVEMIHDGMFSIQTVSIHKCNNEIKEKFFVINSKKKLNDENEVDIDCLVRVGDNNSIISSVNEEKTKNKDDKSEENKTYNTNFFSSYPMFGNHGIRSPFIINSRCFELDKERQFLLIDSNQSNKSNENVINQFIIDKSYQIYKQMVKKAIEMNCKDLFNFFTCLKEDIKKNQFIQDHFIAKLRKIACSYTVFETLSGLKSANDILLPYIEKFDDFNIDDENDDENDDEKSKISDEYFKLITHFKRIDSRVFVTLNDFIHWKPLVWKNFPSLFKIDDFYKKISLINDINSGGSGGGESNNIISGLDTVKSKIEYIKSVLNFIQKQKNFEAILINNPILINESGKLVQLTELYHFNISDIVVKMLNTVKYDDKAHKIHHDLDYFRTKIKFYEFKNEDAFGQIQQLINVDNAPEFMKYCIKSDSNRENMFKYTKLLLLPNLEKEEIDLSKGEINNFSPNIFTMADKYVAKLLSDEVNKQTDISQIEAKSFITLLKNHLTSYDYERFDKEKFYHTKCLDIVEKDLKEKCKNEFRNVRYLTREKIDFDPNNKKCNIEAVRKSDNHKFYFIVKQSEYFSFATIKYIDNKSNANDHYVLSIVFDIDSGNPNVMNFELIRKS